MKPSPEILGRTALFESHGALGARLVPFAGWEMPVQYAGVKAEALAVRQNCGVFDVGHMAQFDVRGAGATDALNRIVSADWSKIPVGRAAYALLLNENGGIQDDVMGYHLAPGHWLVVANASRAQADEAHLRRYLPTDVELSNRYENQSMIALQGPTAEAALQTICDQNLADFAWRDARQATLLGQNGTLVRGGYTGSDGFEWMGDAESAPMIWNALLEKGATPCGLGARDVTRLEAGLPLYGHELRESWTPDVSGCAWAVKPEKGDFVGRDALLQSRQTPQNHRIRGLQMLSRAVPREDYDVQFGGDKIGVVTSGTQSPLLETGIALALLPLDLPLETRVEISIRGAGHAAKVVPTPFVAHARRAI